MTIERILLSPKRIREALNQAYERGHFDWPTNDYPTRSELRAKAVADIERDCLAALSRSQPAQWQAIETAPDGYDGKQFHYVLFKGYSKGRSFSGDVVVSGFMSNIREPVHSYGYKLVITHWMPLPATDAADRAALSRSPVEPTELIEALKELRINANRLCDRNQGGTYEDDCRRSIARADKALIDATPPAVRSGSEEPKA